MTIHPNGTWAYEEEGIMEIPDRDEPFRHFDRNTLTRVGAPSPNPLAQEGSADRSLGIGGLGSLANRPTGGT